MYCTDCNVRLEVNVNISGLALRRGNLTCRKCKNKLHCLKWYHEKGANERSTARSVERAKREPKPKGPPIPKSPDIPALSRSMMGRAAIIQAKIDAVADVLAKPAKITTITLRGGQPKPSSPQTL